MTAISDNSWHSEFGISEDHSEYFIASTADLVDRTHLTSRAHVLRRAFDDLGLDGVLCDQTNPLVYFKQVARIQGAEVSDIHKRFWNHGCAPILVLISPTEVHVFSGLSTPSQGSDTHHHSLVETIKRASLALRKFLPSIESGAFFRKHAKSFDARQRVDQVLLDNLEAMREKLAKIGGGAPQGSLDAFLCRLVFSCYLFDRKVIGKGYLDDLGFKGMHHLRDLLQLKPLSKAKDAIYMLFAQLAKDFNGDLFSDNFALEQRGVTVKHIRVVESFFKATDVQTGQAAFWPYDFGIIPIETISAIYERFLKQSEKDNKGAFYTPRFLAELVLDVALENHSTLLGLRCLDPSCGSGIFLVGFFNRMAEEWRRANPHAGNMRRASELKKLLKSSIFGVDVNPTACRITAFSLYLAYLDQLAPRDIQALQARGGALPFLVAQVDKSGSPSDGRTIWCGDYFDADANIPSDVDLVVGNPPWGSTADEGTPAKDWCDRHERVIPDRQIATAFMWKSAVHVSNAGRVCLVLPFGVLFNHSPRAVQFQESFFQCHCVDRVVNLTDFQKFLFSGARHPTLLMSYRQRKPVVGHSIDYWAPRTDWRVRATEMITISENDRRTLPLATVIRDLRSGDGPQIWKKMTWASPRDRKLLDRLETLPRLLARVRQARDKDTRKPWFMAEGFQPIGENDPPSSRTQLALPSKLFVPAKASRLRLVLLEDDCDVLPSSVVETRRDIRDTRIFKAPHVLVNKGFQGIAFADCDVSFQHAVRGINGPQRDRKLLMFLAAYLRSPLAQFFLFHTSSNWGVSRREVHDEELLRLPFPTPEDTRDPTKAAGIVSEIVHLVQSCIHEMQNPLIDRDAMIHKVQTTINPLVYEYFDVHPTERILVEDTLAVSIPSFRPSRARRSTPAIEPSKIAERDRYKELLCKTLNTWAKGSQSHVIGSTRASVSLGVGLVTLERVERGELGSQHSGNGELLDVLVKLSESASVKLNMYELARGIKFFDGNWFYMVKPLGRRHWTNTAALNDADEIAASVLLHSPGGD